MVNRVESAPTVSRRSPRYLERPRIVQVDIRPPPVRAVLPPAGSIASRPEQTTRNPSPCAPWRVLLGTAWQPTAAHDPAQHGQDHHQHQSKQEIRSHLTSRAAPPGRWASLHRGSSSHGTSRSGNLALDGWAGSAHWDRLPCESGSSDQRERGSGPARRAGM